MTEHARKPLKPHDIWNRWWSTGHQFSSFETTQFPLNPKPNWRKIMTLIHNNSLRHTVLSFAAFSFLLLGASSVLANPVNNPDVPATQSRFEPRTIQEQIQLAGEYLAGHGAPQDWKRAAFWYERAAGAGDPRAQLHIGYLYEAGIGVPRDPVRAVHWYQLAAAGGLVSAKANLGIAYLWGDGVEKNEQEAFALFDEAAQKGSGLAAFYLGGIYHFGIGVVQNDAEAERWYLKGAKLHNPQALYTLGWLFVAGTNHEHNPSTAATLLRESAEAGYVPAMYQLGLLLEKNPDLAKHPGEALTLLNDAANAGSWTASMILGVLARDGREVPYNASSAYFQFRVAALEGGDEAEKLLKNDLQFLATELGADRTAEIDAQAEGWRQRHHARLEFVYKQGEDMTGFPSSALAVPEDGAHAAVLVPVEAE
jgi:TPR repeat protein